MAVVEAYVIVWRALQVFAVVVPKARDSTLLAICNGYVAEEMRDVYAVVHSEVEAVRGISYPAVSENAPVPLVYVRPVAELEKRPRAVELKSLIVAAN